MILDFSRQKADIFSQFDTKQTWQEPIFEFLGSWLNENIIYFPIHTSGSTGQPKNITHTRAQMVESAQRTNAFFGINEHSLLFLALPVRSVGGRMMLVRAQLAGCKIVCVEPSSLPLNPVIANRECSLSEAEVTQSGKQSPKNYEDCFGSSSLSMTINFAAFTPMQVFEMLKSEQQKTAFLGIKNVIIGGGKIPDDLRSKLRELPNNIYETFGMTETVSHIALRKITEEEFDCLPGIFVKKDGSSRLQIVMPNGDELQTNDIVELSDDKHFRWIARYDDVINTGGVKVFANEIETKLKPHISEPFFITKLPDEKYGEKVVLIVESSAKESPKNAEKTAFFADLFSRLLLPYEKPKTILFSTKFIYSEMGKLMRQATLERIA